MEQSISRSMAREWWKAHVDTGDEVDVKQLAEQATSKFKSDPVFREAFVNDFLESVMYDMGQRMLAHQRAALRTSAGLRKQVEEDAARDAAKWIGWLTSPEYCPETHTYIPLGNMTREQVISAAEARMTFANENAFESRWLKAVAGRVGRGQHVGDVLTNEDLSDMRKALTPVQIRKAA